MLSFRSFTVAKKNTDNGGGGESRYSLENLLSHIAEKVRRGTLLCCVSENLR